jgi:hypothetical protein
MAQAIIPALSTVYQQYIRRSGGQKRTMAAKRAINAQVWVNVQVGVGGM